MELGTTLLIAAGFGLLLLIGLKWKKHVMMQELLKMQEKENSYTFVFTKEEWGPSIGAIIINSGDATENFTEEDLAPQNFQIQLMWKEQDGSEKTTAVTASKAGFCDIDGNSLDSGEGAGHLLLEFTRENWEQEPCPYFKTDNGFKWKKDYCCSIKHPKLPSVIETSNDPLITQEAKELVKQVEF